jgi:hypothetical protein
MDVLRLRRFLAWILPLVAAVVCLTATLGVEGPSGLWAALFNALVGAVLSAALTSMLWGFVALALLIGLPHLGGDRAESWT